MLERLEIPDYLGNHDCSGSIGGQLLLDILQQQSPQLVEFNYTKHHHKFLWPDFNDFSVLTNVTTIRIPRMLFATHEENPTRTSLKALYSSKIQHIVLFSRSDLEQLHDNYDDASGISLGEGPGKLTKKDFGEDGMESSPYGSSGDASSMPWGSTKLEIDKSTQTALMAAAQ